MHLRRLTCRWNTNWDWCFLSTSQIQDKFLQKKRRRRRSQIRTLLKCYLNADMATLWITMFHNVSSVLLGVFTWKTPQPQTAQDMARAVWFRFVISAAKDFCLNILKRQFNLTAFENTQYVCSWSQSKENTTCLFWLHMQKKFTFHFFLFTLLAWN